MLTLESEAPVPAVAPAPALAPSPVDTNRNKLAVIPNMIAGASAGVFSKVILQPLDLLRTRLQVQDGIGSPHAKSRPHYRGVLHAAQTIVKSEGLFAFYKGLGPNLLGSSVSWSCYFTVYSFSKNFKLKSKSSLSSTDHLQCAAAAGVVSCLLTNPIWMVKTRMQIQGHPAEYRNAFHCVSSIVTKEGPTALYRGVGPGLTLVSNGAIQFATYEQLKLLAIKYISKTEDNLRSEHFLAMGAISKAFSTLITYPLQVTKSRLYQKDPVTNLPKFRNVLEVWTAIHRYQGPKGFYSGLLAHLMKTSPSSALTFFAYENVLRLLVKLDFISKSP